MEQEAKFVIQGVDYPFPTLDSLTVGEARILSQMATGDVAEILSGEAETASMDVVAAMMVIAYMRGNPTASRKMAERIVDSIPLADLVMPEGDAGPPEPEPSETEPPGSPENSGDSAPSSGDGSSNGSAHPASQEPPTGTPASPTPPISDQQTLTR